MSVAQDALKELTLNGFTGPIKSEARDKPSVRVQLVNPETAAKWLTANTHNRDLRAVTAATYAAVLQRGEWRLTTDAIGFDKDGVLTNGQHRLAAVVASGISALFLVVRGLEREAQNVTDQNLKRSLGDALKLRDPPERYPALLGAALYFLHKLELIWETGEPFGGAHPFRVPSPDQAIARLDANPGLRDLTLPAQAANREVRIPSGMYLALYYLFRQIDPVEADLFHQQLLYGEGLKKTDAAYQLRRYLQTQAQKQYGVSRDKVEREAALVIKAWNFFRESEPCLKLTWTFGQTYKEEFPRPI